MGSTSNNCAENCIPIPTIIGGLLASGGATLGMVAGIAGGAKLLDGRGEAGFAMAGMAVGLYGTYLITNQLQAAEQPRRFVGISVAVVSGAVLFGSIAYEISHHRNVEKERSRLPRPQVVPLVTTTPAGGLIGGLSGRF